MIEQLQTKLSRCAQRKPAPDWSVPNKIWHQLLVPQWRGPKPKWLELQTSNDLRTTKTFLARIEAQNISSQQRPHRTSQQRSRRRQAEREAEVREHRVPTTLQTHVPAPHKIPTTPLVASPLAAKTTPCTRYSHNGKSSRASRHRPRTGWRTSGRNQ